MTRLTLITDDGEYSVAVLRGDHTAQELVDDLFRPLLLAAGYMPQTVDAVLPDCDCCEEDDDEGDDAERIIL